MIIGFDDKTMEPDRENMPSSVRKLFHSDTIQAIISKYSSEFFEIKLHFVEREGQEYPVIEIPPGIKTPVAAKSELCADGSKEALIKSNIVYVRSLSANNTPSTTQATWKDWEKLVEVCFDNREADIGRFLRRHLGSLTPTLIHELAGTISDGLQPKKSTENKLRSYLQESEERFDSVVKERGINLPQHGTWEVGLIIVGEVPPHSANQKFLNLLSSSNPEYTGWPVWLDSRRLSEEKKPYVYSEAWEAVIHMLNPNLFDFMRLDPKGKFYLRRTLEDNMSVKPRAPETMTVLEFNTPVIRTAEAIAVGIKFAKAMGCEPEKTQLAFAFKWTGLRGRRLNSWAIQDGYFRPSGLAYQDEVLAFVNIPLETPSSALAQYVDQAVSPLFQVFEGYKLDMDKIEDVTRRLIERRLY